MSRELAPGAETTRPHASELKAHIQTCRRTEKTEGTHLLLELVKAHIWWCSNSRHTKFWPRTPGTPFLTSNWRHTSELTSLRVEWSSDVRFQSTRLEMWGFSWRLYRCEVSVEGKYRCEVSVRAIYRCEVSVRRITDVRFQLEPFTDVRFGRDRRLPVRLIYGCEVSVEPITDVRFQLSPLQMWGFSSRHLQMWGFSSSHLQMWGFS